jgi:hypothetical protein
VSLRIRCETPERRDHTAFGLHVSCSTGLSSDHDSDSTHCRCHGKEDGFETLVERVSTIEKSLGIYDLAKFTPRA